MMAKCLKETLDIYKEHLLADLEEMGGVEETEYHWFYSHHKQEILKLRCWCKCAGGWAAVGAKEREERIGLLYPPPFCTAVAIACDSTTRF